MEYQPLSLRAGCHRPAVLDDGITGSQFFGSFARLQSVVCARNHTPFRIFQLTTEILHIMIRIGESNSNVHTRIRDRGSRPSEGFARSA